MTDLEQLAARAKVNRDEQRRKRDQAERDAALEQARNIGAAHLSRVLGVAVFPVELVRWDSTYETWPTLFVTTGGLTFRVSCPERGISADDKTPRLAVQVPNDKGEYGPDRYGCAWRHFWDLAALGDVIERYGVERAEPEPVELD